LCHSPKTKTKLTLDERLQNIKTTKHTHQCELTTKPTMPRRNNNNPNALSDFDTAFANADDALTAAADATQTDANNGDPPTTTTHSLGSLLEHNSVTLLVLSSTIKNASSREQRIADAVTNGLTRPHTSEVVNSNSRSISTRRE